jgi:Domain of unknown function (DUF3854)
LADQAQLRRVDSITGGEVIGRKSGNYTGIVIPYFRPDSDQIREFRLRRDQPDLEYDSAGNLKERQKYISPLGRSNMLYLVPGVPPELLRDSLIPIVIAEGEFKTLALWRLAHHRAPDRPRFLPVGVSGVYNWRGTIGKTTGPDGSRLDVKGAIPDLDWIAWDGRRVVIAYDADAVTKEPVRIARSELAAHLRGRGAIVGFLEWGGTRGKGIDDHLASVGPEIVLDEIAHVDFTGSGWKRDLLRSKPPMNNCEGRILPVLANAIAAFRHAPEWGGVLAFNGFALGTVALKPTPWGIVPKGEWSDHEDRRSVSRSGGPLHPDPKGSWRRRWAVRDACSAPRCTPPDSTPGHRAAEFELQPAFLVADESLGDQTPVGRKPVPNQQDVASDIAEQVFQKLNDLLGLDGLFEDLKVEIPEGDAGDDRQGFPIEVELQDRRLPAWCPGASPMRPLARSAFVDEDDRAALFLSFF